MGQSTGTVEFVAPDNVHTTNPDLTNSITGTTGGNYEKLETSGETTVTRLRNTYTQPTEGTTRMAGDNVSTMSPYTCPPCVRSIHPDESGSP
ncbi:immunoglobulin-like domain-containing protein [Pseudomonas auratipiscis]|uniref:immunoglobulin-like domain-containing protein n=1 Tax=Pseudomonas auratipiscis TaxID=3115853 RepID=UPI0035CD0DFD